MSSGELIRWIRPTTTSREIPAPTSPAGTRAPRSVAALILLSADLAVVNASMSSSLLSAHFVTEREVIRAFGVTGLEPPGRACYPCPPPLCTQVLRRGLLRTSP